MDPEIENPVLEFFRWVVNKIENKITELEKEKLEKKKKRTELKNKIRKLGELVTEAKGVISKRKCPDSTLIGKLIEAENCGDAIDYLFHNYLKGHKDLDLNQIKTYRKLKRVTRLSVPNEVIPENLEHLQSFLYIANRGKIIQKFPKWDRKPCFKVVTNITDPPNFDQTEFMLLRYLSLRRVNLRNVQNLNLNKLSYLKYLDLKHTNVREIANVGFECLKKLQMLDLRYTNVKKISDEDLAKLGKLQHLLLGYIKKTGENQLAGTELNVTKLTATNLKTLRAINNPKKDCSTFYRHVRNVVDLSVTGLTTESLKTFWGILEIFHNLTSLGVAVTDQSVIKLEDCKPKLKKNLKRLRMEGSHSGLEKIGGFGELNDLRLYGVCKVATCKIDFKGCRNLKKLVIGDMETVKTVQISSAVLETVVTLKFPNLPQLEEVAYTDKPHSLLRWENSKAQVYSEEVKPSKTIYLRNSGDFPVENSPGLEIYHYDKINHCYKLNATQNNQG